MEDQREEQIKTLEEHFEQLVKSNREEDSLTLLKQKEVFEELANKKMSKMQS